MLLVALLQETAHAILCRFAGEVSCPEMPRHLMMNCGVYGKCYLCNERCKMLEERCQSEAAQLWHLPLAGASARVKLPPAKNCKAV